LMTLLTSPAEKGALSVFLAGSPATGHLPCCWLLHCTIVPNRLVMYWYHPCKVPRKGFPACLRLAFCQNFSGAALARAFSALLVRPTHWRLQRCLHAWRTL
jgi:hypothetical protein